MLSALSTFSQNLAPIPSPAGYENAGKGYVGSPIVFGNDLYLRYIGNDNNYDLLKCDGDTLTELPSPTGYENQHYGYFGSAIVVGNDFYMRYRENNGNFDLFRICINNTGTDTQTACNSFTWIDGNSYQVVKQ
jgi:hypothetical protein